MKIDLTDMTPEMTRELNRIAGDYRKPYTEFIDELSEIYNDETGFWWDTPLASRNVWLCQCFLDICTLRLILDYAKQNELDEVVVGKRAMRRAVLDNAEGVSVRVVEPKNKGIKSALGKIPWIRRKYNFCSLRRSICGLQNYRCNQNLGAFQGRELTLIGTYRVPAETRMGVLQDRYFPGLKENCAEDVVFLSIFAGTEPNLLDVVHDRNDHICIEDWIEKEDFREIEKYMAWCSTVKVNPCRFDGMNITTLVEDALRVGSWNDNSMLGIARGNSLCRIVEQWGLKIKCLLDWFEGQPSSNAMIRRFRKRFPNVPTVAYSTAPYEENNLGMYPSPRQVEQKVVPEYYGIIGKIWVNQIRQFSRDVKCIAAPALRHKEVFDRAAETSMERRGVLLVLPYFIDASVQLLQAFGEAIQGLDSTHIGAIYIKNHPIHQGHHIADYGVEESLFHDWNVNYLIGDLYEAMRGKAIIILSKTTSTLETMLTGAYTINFVPAGDLSLNAVPKEAESKLELAYSSEDLRACLQNPKTGLSDEEAKRLREASLIKVNRETVGEFLKLQNICLA